MVLPMMDNPPQVCLIYKWVNNKLWLADCEWVGLMQRDKAAMIVEAFDLEDMGRFLILSDWMEDAGEKADEIQRFREGNWHDQDYAHATITLFWKQIQEFRNCPSTKCFIRLLQANWKHEKFLKWYSPIFNEGQKHIYDMMVDPKKWFEPLFGKSMRESVKRHHWGHARYTENQFREICDHAKEVCYFFKAKKDLEAWSELWKDRLWYIERPLKTWEKAYKS